MYAIVETFENELPVLSVVNCTWINDDVLFWPGPSKYNDYLTKRKVPDISWTQYKISKILINEIDSVKKARKKLDKLIAQKEITSTESEAEGGRRYKKRKTVSLDLSNDFISASKEKENVSKNQQKNTPKIESNSSFKVPSKRFKPSSPGAGSSKQCVNKSDPSTAEKSSTSVVINDRFLSDSLSSLTHENDSTLINTPERMLNMDIVAPLKNLNSDLSSVGSNMSIKFIKDSSIKSNNADDSPSIKSNNSPSVNSSNDSTSTKSSYTSPSIKSINASPLSNSNEKSDIYSATPSINISASNNTTTRFNLETPTKKSSYFTSKCNCSATVMEKIDKLSNQNNAMYEMLEKMNIVLQAIKGQKKITKLDVNFVSPKLPIKSIAEISNLNQKLVDENYRDQMALLLQKYVTHDKTQASVRKIVNKLIHYDTLAKYTWTGKTGIQTSSEKHEAFNQLGNIICLFSSTINFKRESEVGSEVVEKFLKRLVCRAKQNQKRAVKQTKKD